jgi:DnaJ-class molecular chaperone
MRRDYYAVLGIAATAPPREVRRAYQRLARQYSPDVNFWDERARELFEEIAEAFRVLGDPTARQMYDQYGHAVGADAAEIEGAVATTSTPSSIFIRRGRSVRASASTSSDFRRVRAVPHGVGRKRCSAHKGVRRVVEPGASVPAGVVPAAQIRVGGEGNAGPFGGPRGDLLVSTRVGEHPFFQRKGDNVHCDVPISVWEALLGARIRVPTPSGEAVLVVPPGTTGGQVFRLRGQGLPRLTGESTGDLYVTVRVEVPTGLDARTHELVRELARLMPVETRTALERYRGGAE